MEETECYICMDPEGKLITPCGCKGTVGVVHLACLQKWIRISGKICCRTCGEIYHCETEKRYIWRCFPCFCGSVPADGFDSTEIVPGDEE